MTAVEGLVGGALHYYRTTQNANPASLQSFLNNVGTITGNSGATWFLSLMGFSSDFVSQIENNTLFGASGYMTKMNAAFGSYMSGETSSLNSLWDKISQTPGLGLLTNNPLADAIKQVLNVAYNIGGLDWNQFLAGTVFAPIVNGKTAAQLLNGTNFFSSAGASSRTSAVQNQAMVFTTALATDLAALGDYTKNIFGYNAPTGNVTQATVTNARQNGLAATQSGGTQSYFIESNVTSAAAGSTVVAAPLPSIGTDLTTGFAQPINVNYSTSNINPLPFTSASSVSTTINNLNFNGVSAFGATAQSSSALATLGSDGPVNATLNRLLGNLSALNLTSVRTLVEGLVKEMAPAVSVASNGTATNIGAVSNTTSPSSLASNPLLRIADGGYVDNSSVTSALEYMTAEARSISSSNFNGFNVTAMQTFTAADNTYDTGLDAVSLGFRNLDQTIRNLFTGSNQSQIFYNLNIDHPTAAIFDAQYTAANSPVENGQTYGLLNPYWTGTSGGLTIRDYKLSVKTVDNSLGVLANQTGTMNVWEVDSNAGTAYVPDFIMNTAAGSLAANLAGQAGFSQYSDLFTNIENALQITNNNHVGAAALAQNLGYA